MIDQFITKAVANLKNLRIGLWLTASTLLITGCASLPMESSQYEELPQEDQPAQEQVSQEPTSLSLVWIPSRQRTGNDILEIIDPLARRYDQWTISIALTVDTLKNLTPDEKTRFLELQEQGKISLAVELYSGLPIGILTTTKKFIETNFAATLPPSTPQRIIRDFELPRLILMTEEAWTQAFPESTQKPGLILPFGSWPAATPKFKALKHFSWVVSASTNGLMGADGFSPWYTALALTSSELPLSHWRGILVLDETATGIKTNAAELLERAFEQYEDGDTPWKLTPIDSWQNREKTGPLYPDENPCLKPCSTWTTSQNLALLWGTPAQEKYWNMMSQWRKDILQYQNSGKANMSALDQLWDEFYLWLNIRVPSSLVNANGEITPTSLEPDLIKAIQNAYQKMFPVLGKYPQITDSSTLSPNGSSGADAAGMMTRRRFIDQFDDRLMGTDSPNIDQMVLSWDEQEISFEIKFLNSFENAPLFELYIDLNNQSFAGNSDNFDGTLHCAAKDYWEYAIKGASDSSLTLFRYSPQGPPRQRALVQNAIQWQDGLLTGKFPRSWIAGKTPGKWGWALCAQNDAAARDCLSVSATNPDVLPFAR